MTAFAASETELNQWMLSCELRSVNHRYLDITVKMPERIRSAESDIRALLSAKINRGKIECLLNVKKQSGRQSFLVDPDAVAALISATQRIESQMGSSLSFSALDVLAFPGIQQEPEFDKGGLCEALFDLVSLTAERFTETREREGGQLKTLIEERCKKIQDFLTAAKQRIPEATAALRNKLTDRVNELKAQPDFDRLEQELLYLSQKLDITEEIDRLETHINEVYRVMNQKDPVGRRLDFLMQELNREANTLGSKSTDKELTQISIELKVLIEQIREQVQNIE